MSITRDKAEVIAADIILDADILGTQTIYIPAGAMTPRSTAGAVVGSVETSTNKVMLPTLDFDGAADNFAQFTVAMPKAWDAGTLSAQFIWSHPATTVNFGVLFSLQAVALRNDLAADTAFGNVTGGAPADTGGTTDDIYITPGTGPLTVGNSPVKEDFVTFQVYRDVSVGQDTLAVVARLHGIKLFYTTDAATDA